MVYFHKGVGLNLVGCEIGGRWTLRNGGRWEIIPINRTEMGGWHPKQVDKQDRYRLRPMPHPQVVTHAVTHIQNTARKRMSIIR